MRLDTILTRDDGPDIALEVQRMRQRRSIVATGVARSGGFTSQFRVQLDEPRGRWTVDYDTSEGTTSSDRTLHSAESADGADSAFAEEAFPSGTPEEVLMLMPELLPCWGRTHGSFAPMLAQHIGERSLLLTLEHSEDPAFRETLVIDRLDGVARRRVSYNRGMIITSVEPLDGFDELPPPVFEPITDWIRAEY